VLSQHFGAAPSLRAAAAGRMRIFRIQDLTAAADSASVNVR
jgi:hypothetical protein